MFTVIGESPARFSALSSVPAYILLMLAGLGTAVISYIHRAPFRSPWAASACASRWNR